MNSEENSKFADQIQRGPEMRNICGRNDVILYSENNHAKINMLEEPIITRAVISPNILYNVTLYSENNHAKINMLEEPIITRAVISPNILNNGKIGRASCRERV